MHLGLLLAGSFLFAPHTTLPCANSAIAQTSPISGPKGIAAVLTISSEDDHDKNTHLCTAEYKLAITRDPQSAPTSADLLSSDGDWERGLSAQLNGFSEDGTKVFGTFSETGDTPMYQVFEYNIDDGSTRLFDLSKQVAQRSSKKCHPAIQVIGTAENDVIAIALVFPPHCPHTSRWLLTSEHARLRPIPRHASVRELYALKTNAASAQSK
jgi:hypothetical protein